MFHYFASCAGEQMSNVLFGTNCLCLRQVSTIFTRFLRNKEHDLVETDRIYKGNTFFFKVHCSALSLSFYPHVFQLSSETEMRGNSVSLEISPSWLQYKSCWEPNSSNAFDNVGDSVLQGLFSSTFLKEIVNSMWDWGLMPHKVTKWSTLCLN